MGTKVQYKSYLPGYHPMGELNDDSNSRTWPVYYGDKPSSNGQFHDPYSQRTIADGYFGYHTEAVKQKMLEHEATFKRQVYELHRVYRVQRDLMDELKMNELQKQSMGIETSMSSCSASQRQDAQLWHASSAFRPSSSSSVKPAVLGAKDFHSTPSFLSGKNPQNGLVSPSNAGSSKDCDVEIIDCRPSQARSKFNLELRADEYIDVEEPKYSSKRPCVSSYPSNGSCENPPSSSAKMLLGGAVQIDSRGIGARQNNGGLADLNEKIQIQQPNSSSLNFVGCDSSFRSNQQFSSKSPSQTFPQELMLNSHQGRDDSRPRNLSMGQKENGNWSLMLESARSKGQTAAFPQNLLSEKISVFNKGQEVSHFQTSQIKMENWKERSEGGSKHSATGIDFFNRLSGPRQLGTSISTSMSPWDKSGSCVSQKSAADVPHPCFNPAGTLPQSLRSSSKSAWTVGQGWQMNSDSGRDCACQNGFYKGTCSGPGPTRCPTGGSDYLNRSSGSHVASGLSFSQNGSLSLKGATSVNASATKGIDLNIVSVGDSRDSVEDTRFDRLNRDHHVADLPWLKSSSTGLRNGMISGLASSAYGMDSKRPTAKKIMGVPIFGESPKGASSCRPSLSKADEMGTARNVRDFDMNLPCESEDKDAETAGVSGRNHIDLNTCLTEDDALVTISTPGCDSGNRVIRGFDLEAPGETEEEELVQPTPQEPEDSDEDLLTVAAEAIVGISSCRKLILTENPARDPPEAASDALKWFSDVISSCANDEDKKLLDEIGENNAEENDTEDGVESMDYFEYMTLQLPETKEEDYLPDYPKPPEPLGAGPFTARTRKGQARRGRPRRDFQRDILPGLTSLARHEVTEDLQTFGGLMRAMGHSWQSGLTRRAGPRRGRPRLTPVQPPNPSPATTPSPIRSPLLPRKPASEASPSPACSPSPQKRTKTTAGRELIHMEDNHRSLTGWGKTTRRPRRQRCPAIGNASFLHTA